MERVSPFVQLRQIGQSIWLDNLSRDMLAAGDLKRMADAGEVTGITTNQQTNAGGQTTNSPTLTVTPFFSGIVLDVTPQIDEDGNILLHVHPSVSSVSERTKVLNLGSLGGSITLPLASSTVSETDTVVRVRDGHIVAIGGKEELQQSTHPRVRQFLDRVPEPEVAGEQDYLQMLTGEAPPVRI